MTDGDAALAREAAAEMEAALAVDDVVSTIPRLNCNNSWRVQLGCVLCTAHHSLPKVDG